MKQSNNNDLLSFVVILMWNSEINMYMNLVFHDWPNGVSSTTSVIYMNNMKQADIKIKNKLERSQRICHFCNQNFVETEQHFILTCPLYNDL